MSKKVKIGITGSRTYENKLKIKEFVYDLRNRTDQDITIVSLGDLQGADKHIKKFALDFGYGYSEYNPPHTPKTLYSALPEAFYNRPYTNKNIFVRDKIYASSVDMCVVFDNGNPLDKKSINIMKEFKKQNRKVILIQ
jgi:hypothetical protein